MSIVSKSVLLFEICSRGRIHLELNDIIELFYTFYSTFIFNIKKFAWAIKSIVSFQEVIHNFFILDCLLSCLKSLSSKSPKVFAGIDIVTGILFVSENFI